MATLIEDCPYCAAKAMTFNAAHAVGNTMRSNQWNVLLTCGGCSRGIVALLDDGGRTRNPCEHLGDLRSRDFRGSSFHVLEIEPHPKPTDVPEHLPPAVAKAFKEGCEVLNLSADAAFGMFRKALELGLKDLSPDIEAYKLHKRIDAMAAKGLLTESLRDWSHHLRLDANEMIHEEGVSDVAHAREIESFTRFVLIYLFTLPQSVFLARGQA